MKDMEPESPRWLDGNEQRAWRLHLQAAQMLQRAIEADLKKSGMSLPEYEILVRLSEAPDGTLRMGEVAESSLLSKSRLSHTVARLEDRGWAERSECAGDRRGVHVALTEAGRKAIEKAAPGHARLVAKHLFDHLGEEETRALETIARRTVESLRGECESAGECPETGQAHP